jgi:hypothetical protein
MGYTKKGPFTDNIVPPGVDANFLNGVENELLDLSGKVGKMNVPASAGSTYIEDCNAITMSGFYYGNQGTANAPALGYFTIIDAHDTNGIDFTQIAIMFSNNDMYVRHTSGGIPGNWVKFGKQAGIDNLQEQINNINASKVNYGKATIVTNVNSTEQNSTAYLQDVDYILLEIDKGDYITTAQVSMASLGSLEVKKIPFIWTGSIYYLDIRNMSNYLNVKSSATINKLTITPIFVG